MIRSYQGYFVNGFKFHTLDYGRSRKTMNSGVCVKDNYYNDFDRDFYGILTDIIELEYFGIGNKVVLFKCHWFDTERGLHVDPRHGLVDIKHKSILASNEPFILAEQSQQVYFSTYPSTKKDRRHWWAVFKTKARSRFNLRRNDGGQILDLNEGVYQEVEVSNPRIVAYSDELDNPTVHISGEYEEVNQFAEEEEEEEEDEV